MFAIILSMIFCIAASCPVLAMGDSGLSVRQGIPGRRLGGGSRHTEKVVQAQSHAYMPNTIVGTGEILHVEHGLAYAIW